MNNKTKFPPIFGLMAALSVSLLSFGHLYAKDDCFEYFEPEQAQLEKIKAEARNGVEQDYTRTEERGENRVDLGYGGEGLDANLSNEEILGKYGEDLNEKMKDAAAIQGREFEVQQVISILLRKKKANPVLLGEAGVGKTAIVEEVARRLANGEIPALAGKRIININMAKVVAGTTYRGQFEERMQGIATAAEEDPNAILFVDEAHTIMGAGSAGGGNMDAANILKPPMARGSLKAILATTSSEYKYIVQDPAMERRTRPVYIGELSVEALMSIADINFIEDYLPLQIIPTPAAIDRLVEASQFAFPGRQNPDILLDILDELRVKAIQQQDGGYLQMQVTQHQATLQRLQNRLMILEIQANTDEPGSTSAEQVKAQIAETKKQLQESEARLEAFEAGKPMELNLAWVEEHLPTIGGFDADSYAEMFHEEAGEVTPVIDGDSFQFTEGD